MFGKFCVEEKGGGKKAEEEEQEGDDEAGWEVRGGEEGVEGVEVGAGEGVGGEVCQGEALAGIVGGVYGDWYVSGFGSWVQ